MFCPRGPQSKLFSLNFCRLCRATTRSGYEIRRRLPRESRALGSELDLKTVVGTKYNFHCDSFPWNVDRVVVDPEGGEIKLEGVEPQSILNCQKNVGGKCTKYGLPLPFYVDLVDGEVRRGKDISLCEICFSSPYYSESIEELFGRDDISE